MLDHFSELSRPASGLASRQKDAPSGTAPSQRRAGGLQGQPSAPTLESHFRGSRGSRRQRREPASSPEKPRQAGEQIFPVGRLREGQPPATSREPTPRRSR